MVKRGKKGKWGSQSKWGKSKNKNKYGTGGGGGSRLQFLPDIFNGFSSLVRSFRVRFNDQNYNSIKSKREGDMMLQLFPVNPVLLI